MRRGFRVGKNNQTMRDYIFTDMGGDQLGITAEVADPKKCSCGLKAHLTIQTRGVWSPNNVQDLDDLIDALVEISNGFKNKVEAR